MALLQRKEKERGKHPLPHAGDCVKEKRKTSNLRDRSRKRQTPLAPVWRLCEEEEEDEEELGALQRREKETGTAPH